MELNKRIAAEAAELAREFWAEVEAAFDAEIARVRATLPAHAVPPHAHRPRDDEIIHRCACCAPAALIGRGRT